MRLRPPEAWFVIALAAIAVIPLWIGPVVPTQDGPSHLFNAWVIAHLGDPDLGLDRHFRVIPWTPNWGGTAPLIPLLWFLPPAIAEKAFLSLLVAGIALGAGWFIRRAGADAVIGTAVGGVIAHGFLFATGLTAYLAALAGGLFLAGFAARSMAGWRAGAAGLLFCVLFWMHSAGALAGAFLFVLVAVLPPLLHRGPRWESAFRALVPILVLLPLLLADRILRQGEDAIHPAFRSDPRSALDRMWELASGGLFRAFDPYDGIAGTILLLLVAGLVAVRLVRRAPRQPASLPCLGGAVLALGGYLLLPWSMGEGAYVPERILPLVFLLPIPWATGEGMAGRRAFRVAAAALLAVVAAYRGTQYQKLGALTERLTACHASLPPGTLFVMQDRLFRGMPVDAGYHLWGRIGAATGGIPLDDYEAGLTGLFPVAFREEARRLAGESRRDGGGRTPPGVAVLGLCP